MLVGWSKPEALGTKWKDTYNGDCGSWKKTRFSDSVATWDTDWVSGVVEMSEGMDEKDATVGNVWTKDVRPPEFTLGIVYLSNVSYRGSRRVQVEPKGSRTE